MADGMAALVFHYDGVFDEVFSDGKTERSIIAAFKGPSQKFRRFSINRPFGIFGANIYPYAIPFLFSIGATDLKDQMVDIKSLFGRVEDFLEERMMLATNAESRADILSQFLESRLINAKPVVPGIAETVNYIFRTHGHADVDMLAQRNFSSMRQFQRNFKQYVGFSPKLFSRIVRFQKVLDQNTSTKTLTQIGMDAGYTDQSHFIRDFREFSGITPKEYFFNKL